MAEQGIEAAGDRLDGGERVIQLVADDADQAPPGLALLLPERLAHVREDEHLVRLPALPEFASPCFPPARPARKVDVLNTAVRLQRGKEAEILSRATGQQIGRLREQTLTEPVDEHQPLRAVEREN